MPKFVLAYSGGLDTSVILRWLIEDRGLEVVTYTADVGQGEEVEEARLKALATGASEAIVGDLVDEFVSDFVFPALRANAVYEGYYLLGTSLARPVIAKGLVEYDVDDVAAIKGRQSDALEAILGHTPRSAVIHRDHLVLM